MSLTRINKWLALFILALIAPTAQAQLFGGVDMMEVNPDYQFFAPAVLDDFDETLPNTGWFSSYERVQVWVSRPETSNEANKTDRTWGNRYDVGFMSESGSGWSFSHWHIDGPNARDLTRTERTNRLRVDFDPDAEPPQDNNNRRTGARDYEIEQSLNQADLSSFELNKTFRLKPNESGMIVETFFGVRYMKFQDFFRNDMYERGAIVMGVFDPNDDEDPSNDDAERLTRLSATTQNSMVGGQIGFNLWKKCGRWALSSNVRAFAGPNYQSFTRQTFIEFTIAGPGLDAATDATETQLISFRANSEEFVVGAEARFDAALKLSRDVSMLFGFTYLELYKGIGRGNDPLANTQNVSNFGLSFGVAVNK